MQKETHNTQTKLNDLLNEAIQLDNSAFGNIQLLEQKNNTLSIVAQKGFKNNFLKYFQSVTAFDTSACGRAIGIGSTIIIDDVNIDIAFSVHKKIAQSAGFRGVKSVPIATNNGELLGLISTHYTNPFSVSREPYPAEFMLRLAGALSFMRIKAEGVE